MLKNKQILVVALALALSACGGGGGSSSGGSSASLKGKAIDGYISGATVYLDLNFNNVMDSNEPHAITQEQGDFDLNIPANFAECAQYVPVVVEVPEGAIDMDFPNTPIEEAYSMVFPPQFALSTDRDLLNLTPLTSVVWQQVERELRTKGSDELSCKSILNEQELREDIAQRLVEQERRVASRYNITVDELYGDYVESENVSLHQIAQDIVPGLQKSYEETKELLTTKPNASLAWVEYFLGKWDSSGSAYDDNWYRYEFVQISNGNFNSETYVMSADLGTKLNLFAKHSMSTEQRDGVNIEKTIGLELATNGYNCSVSEWLETILEQSSGVRNTSYKNVLDWAECENLTNGHLVQALVTKDYLGAELISYTEHTFNEGNRSGFEHLIGVTDSITQDDLVPVRNTINTDFYSEEGHGADHWSRTKNEFNDDELLPAQVMTSHENNGKWERLTTYHNGTHKKECGLSEAELSEVLCDK